MKNFKVIRVFIFLIIFFGVGFSIKVLAQSNDYDMECDDVFWNNMTDCVNNKEAEKCKKIQTGDDCACSGVVSDPVLMACAIRCDNKVNECNLERSRIYKEYKECVMERDDLLSQCDNNCDKIFDSFRKCIDDIGGACKSSPWRCDNNSNDSEENNIGDGGNYDNNIDKSDDGGIDNNLDNSLVGLPVDLSVNTSPCIGETPKNSESCSGDNEKIFYYTKKELAESCSVPEGSEPKCEYVCKGGYNLVDGECESTGFFSRIMKWLGSFFQ